MYVLNTMLYIRQCSNGNTHFLLVIDAVGKSGIVRVPRYLNLLTAVRRDSHNTYAITEGNIHASCTCLVCEQCGQRGIVDGRRKCVITGVLDAWNLSKKKFGNLK